jgi:hypothetical protein
MATEEVRRRRHYPALPGRSRPKRPAVCVHAQQHHGPRGAPTVRIRREFGSLRCPHCQSRYTVRVGRLIIEANKTQGVEHLSETPTIRWNQNVVTKRPISWQSVHQDTLPNDQLVAVANQGVVEERRVFIGARLNSGAPYSEGPMITLFRHVIRFEPSERDEDA